ncbi:contact-dependent growth inhibition system immunity protein [Pseudomonas sp. AU12215]|uniref:contact-dependent growth inhibition system immunity protein n=1 Tax=Pseudomonas sp. AU12215 TaxID=1860123 RepID=UPI0009F6BCD0|nr:contact-dependent growth inhibition system immunity protein [Pseudomonas sp. AU12215]
MSKPDKRSFVYVKSNKDFTFLETYSGYWNFLPDPEGKKYLLSPSASDGEIGSAIYEAVSVSRQVDPQSCPEFFDLMGRVAPEYAEWVNGLMKEFGYKTKRAMFKDMKSCAVELVGRSIVMQPSHHEKLEAWSEKGISKDDYVVVSADSSPDQIGFALRLALSRCT